MRRGGRALALLATVTLSGCGARSGLDALALDAAMPAPHDAAVSPADAGPLVPPACGESIPAGQLRGSVGEIHSGTAIDAEGNLYVARRVGDDWFAVSLDPCLRERWSTPVPLLSRSPRRMHVGSTIAARCGWWPTTRSTSGTSLRAASPSPRCPRWVPRATRGWASPTARVPSTSVFRSSDDKSLIRLVGDRWDETPLAAPSSFVYEDECALVGTQPTCFSVAFEHRPLRMRWMVDEPRLLDGTFRHVIPPGSDGARLWTIAFGISTYELIGVDLETGARTVRVPLMRTTRGQSELLLGPPVVTEDANIVVYRHGSGVPGALVAFERDGTELWRYPAARTRRSTSADGAIFDYEGTHLVGRGGLVYLAVGDSVHAVRAESGELVWRLDGFDDLNESAINLSVRGDLYVLDASGSLHAIATSSAGLAPTPWPVAGGNARHAYAR